MKTRLAVLVVITAAAFAASAVLPAKTPIIGPQNVYAKTCHVGYTHAVVSWSTRHRCLRRGQYCKKVRNPEYFKYGFKCVNGTLRKLKGK